MPDRDTVRNRPLAVIAGVPAVAETRWIRPVTVPLAAAALVVAAARPIEPWLERVPPPRVAYLGTALVLAAVLAGFAAVPFSVSQVVRSFARRLEDFGRIYAAHAGWARARGLPVLGAGAASLGWLRSRGRRSSAPARRWAASASSRSSSCRRCRLSGASSARSWTRPAGARPWTWRGRSPPASAATPGPRR